LELREPRLDGLRGLAVALVMLAHVTLFGAPRTRLDALLSAPFALGWCGVDLFFVLSGFLITRILLATRDSHSYYTTFWARRALRILPLYWLLLAFLLLIVPRIAVLAPLGRLWLSDTHPTGFWYWLFLSNWKVAISGWDSQALSIVWSLAIEEQFYLFWPFVVRRLDEKQLFGVCLAIAAGAMALRLALFAAGADPLLSYVATVCRLDPLAIGAVIAVLSRREGGLAPHAGRARWILFGAFWLFSTMAFYFRAQAPLATVDAVTQNMNPWMQIFGFSALAVGFGALLVATLMAPADSLLARCFELRWLREIGRVSYALYLVHVAIWIAIKPALLAVILPWPYPLAQLVAWSVVGVLSYAVARASWVLLESRVLALKRHFPYWV
jgi:peptidoglycan/LPS O-acetylase OafA/YrhL